MALKKKLPSPITILMFVIIAAAGATWLIPAGQYNRLAYSADTGFTINMANKDTVVPLTQHTLDSLQIKISLEKFKLGAIRKPVSIPGTYHKMPANGQGWLQVLQEIGRAHV